MLKTGHDTGGPLPNGAVGRSSQFRQEETELGVGAAGERLICGDKGGSLLWTVERIDRITLKRG